MKSRKVSRGSAAVKTAVILGAGRMGGDIALALARAGWRCEVMERDASVRARVARYWRRELERLRAARALGRIALHADLPTIPWKGVDLVVETITEDLAAKHALLAQVAPLAPRGAIIATNTSGYRVRDVFRRLAHPERSAGLHFFMPAHVMPAVEVTRGPKTSRATLARLVGWMEEAGKVPVVLQRDIPGMLVNRIQHAMYREIYHLIDEGIATPRDVDRAVRFGFGFRYPIVGPVISRDIHGLPVHLETARNLYPTLHNGTRPGRLLAKLVREGHHGVRTGRGFYEWNPATVERRLARFNRLLEEGFARVKRWGEPAEF
jgi:3-hydroxybutyryl-CoA dehydrogenase